MRTKTVVLSALLGLASSAAVMAQSSVYSLNAVGYVNVAFPKGQFKMFANPLNTTNNSVGALFGSNVPDGSNLYKWNGTGFTILTYASFLGGWDQPTVTLNPGEGAFFLASDAFTNTFVGEVLQGSLTNSIPVGFSMLGSLVPQAGTVDVLELTKAVSDGDLVYKWNGVGYDIFTYASFLGGWSPSTPSLDVAESVFIASGTGGKWTRSFNVNGN